MSDVRRMTTHRSSRTPEVTREGHRGRCGRDRAVPDVADAHAVDARAAVHGRRARVRRPQGRPRAVAGRPLRRPRSGDEGARPRARVRSGSTMCGSRSRSPGSRVCTSPLGPANWPSTEASPAGTSRSATTARSPSPSSPPNRGRAILSVGIDRCDVIPTDRMRGSGRSAPDLAALRSTRRSIRARALPA